MERARNRCRGSLCNMSGSKATSAVPAVFQGTTSTPTQGPETTMETTTKKTQTGSMNRLVVQTSSLTFVKSKREELRRSFFFV